MWRPIFPSSVFLTLPARSKRSDAVLFVLVRFEPVRSADPPSISGNAAVNASSAICDALRADGRVHRHLREVARQLALHAARELGCEFRESLLVRGEALVPFGFDLRTLRLLVPRRVHLRRHDEG